jgi:hypothetical protein
VIQLGPGCISPSAFHPIPTMLMHIGFHKVHLLCVAPTALASSTTNSSSSKVTSLVFFLPTQHRRPAALPGTRPRRQEPPSRGAQQVNRPQRTPPGPEPLDQGPCAQPPPAAHREGPQPLPLQPGHPVAVCGSLPCILPRRPGEPASRRQQQYSPHCINCTVQTQASASCLIDSQHPHPVVLLPCCVV